MTDYSGNADVHERSRAWCQEQADRAAADGDEKAAAHYRARARQAEQLRDNDLAIQQRRRQAQVDFARTGRPLTGRQLLETDGYDPFDDEMELDELRRRGDY